MIKIKQLGLSFKGIFCGRKEFNLKRYPKRFAWFWQERNQQSKRRVSMGKNGCFTQSND